MLLTVFSGWSNCVTRIKFPRTAYSEAHIVELPLSKTDESWMFCDNAAMQELGSFDPSLGSVRLCRRDGM